MIRARPSSLALPGVGDELYKTVNNTAQPDERSDNRSQHMTHDGAVLIQTAVTFTEEATKFPSVEI
jgi:hypothetical protein